MHIRGEYLYIGVENARFGSVDFDSAERLYRSTKSVSYTHLTLPTIA